MREFIIDDKHITDDSDAWIVAEIGHNHCGDVDRAAIMIQAARNCGCDAAKLQKRTNREMYHPSMYSAPYENINSYGRTYGEHREALEFDVEQHKRLKKTADDLGMAYFSTAFDIQAADDLMEIGVPCIKIASGDLTNTPLIRYVSALDVPMILSTGGASMDDVKRAVDVMRHSKFALLHCVASYPNEPWEMNLMAIAAMRDAFPDTVIGLSDHYNGICMSVAAYVLGARIFEKHFTLNHTWKGTDHALSLEPKGMHDMVRDLRRLRFAFGDGVKRRLSTEETPLRKMEKGLYYKTCMAAGETLHAENLSIMSPAAELYPYRAAEVISHELIKDVAEGDPVSLEDLR